MILPDVSPGRLVEVLVNWLNMSFSGFFELLSIYLETALTLVEACFSWPHPALLAALVAGLSWRLAGRGAAVFGVVGLAFCWMMGFWQETMATLALITVATLVSLLIAIPCGILAALHPMVDRVTRPVMDLMQTMPPWVYLVPAVILFSTGRTPAVMATAIFAIPPALRLTCLGITHVSPEAVEAAVAFGGTRWQILSKVQLPMALPTILAGINQCIMLALSMAVLAGLIGAGGLGSEIVRALSRMKVGLGVRSGLCIVILAIVLDRLSQGSVQAVSRRKKS